MKQEKDQQLSDMERIKAALDPNRNYEGHINQDPQDWRRSFKELILALKGVGVEFWNDVLDDDNWWAAFGRNSMGSGVDEDGKPTPTGTR